MTSPSQAFHVVVGCDFSPLSELAITMAASVAGPVTGSTIEVIHVMSPRLERPAGGSLDDLYLEVRKELKGFVKAALVAAGAPQVRLNLHVVPGEPAAEILRLAEDVTADLIVVGTHGRIGVRRLLLGSVAESLTRDARCPVLVMRNRRYERHPELEPEPPCPDCLAIRDQTSGAGRWCAAHDRPWVPPHRYAYRDGTLHPYHSDGMG